MKTGRTHLTKSDIKDLQDLIDDHRVNDNSFVWDLLRKEALDEWMESRGLDISLVSKCRDLLSELIDDVGTIWALRKFDTYYDKHGVLLRSDQGLQIELSKSDLEYLLSLIKRA